MRLLVATPLFPPDSGGPATYAALLAAEFPHPVTVVSFGAVRKFPKVLRHFLYFWKVFVSAKKTDVVLALDPASVGLPTLWAARLRGRKFAVKIVGDYAWEQGVQRFGIASSLDDFVRQGRVPFPVSVLRAVQTHVAKSADQILVPSEYLKKIIIAWGIPGEKIAVVHNAIELEEGGVLPLEVAALPRPRIVTVGRLVPWKNISGVIDAVDLLSISPSLVIVGDGPERASLQKQAEAKLGSVAVLTGALSHADTLAVIKDADIFVLNSTYEGLSHLLIEALMLGTPTIATQVGGNSELIKSEINGLLVPVSGTKEADTQILAHAIERLLSDPALAQKFRGEALGARERFSADTMRRKTAEILEAI